MPDDLDELEALANAATPGPWESSCFQVYANERRYKVTHTGFGQMGPGFSVQQETNATFIAAADPDVVKALIARVRKAEAMVKACTDDGK